MTDEQIDCLRWITIYLWYSGIPACDHTQKEFRLLSYTSLGDLRTSVQWRLVGVLPLPKLCELRDLSLRWVRAQPESAQREMLKAFQTEHNLYAKEKQSDGSESSLSLLTC